MEGWIFGRLILIGRSPTNGWTVFPGFKKLAVCHGTRIPTGWPGSSFATGLQLLTCPHFWPCDAISTAWWMLSISIWGTQCVLVGLRAILWVWVWVFFQIYPTFVLMGSSFAYFCCSFVACVLAARNIFWNLSRTGLLCRNQGMLYLHAHINVCCYVGI